MNNQFWSELGWAIAKFFSPEWIRASLVMALLAAVIAMVVCAYYGHWTQKTSFVLWTGGWSFYAVYLVTNMVLEYAEPVETLHLARLLCAGLSAWFFLLGGMHLHQHTVPRWKLVIGAVTVVAINCLAMRLWRNELGATAVMFGLMGLAGGYMGWRHWSQHDRRTRLLALGFALWAANLLFLPWFGLWPVSKAVAYAGSGVLTLAVTIGLIIREQHSLIELRYRTVVDAANAAIFVVDLSSLEVLDANRAAQRLVRRNLGDLRGLSFLDICPDLHAGAGNVLDHRTMFSAVFKAYNEVQILRHNAGPVLCEGETHLLDWQRRPALQINLREVDKEKKIGQLVRRAEKMSSLGQLIAGVAHELNNPLAVVVGYAQLLSKQGGLDEKARTMNRKILHESERAARIVRDLLSFARPCEPQLTVVDINALVANLLSVREADLRAHQVQCICDLAAELPQTKADPMQIEQVLTNLVTNAIHAMAEQAAERTLTVSTESTGFHIRITVADSGPGIAPEVVGRIFDPFFTTKAPGKGTGLGLSISNTIMQEHRGKIWAQSELGKGAKFFVELPLVACEVETAETAPAEPGRTADSGAAGAAVRILVVDDEPGIREVVTDILAAAGFVVEAVATGKEALRRIGEVSYDLVISDLCMPGMDGEELWRLVQEQNPSLAKRIIFLTGDTVSPKTRSFLERTGNRWLTKPFNIAEIEKLVRAQAKADPLRALTQSRPTSPARRYHPAST